MEERIKTVCMYKFIGETRYRVEVRFVSFFKSELFVCLGPEKVPRWKVASNPKEKRPTGEEKVLSLSPKEENLQHLLL